MSATALDSPLRIGTLTVDGRLYKSATGESRAAEAGFVTDELLEFYEPMLIGGVLLIITGNAFISTGGKGVVREIGADSDDQIPGLHDLADLVHRYGSTINLDFARTFTEALDIPVICVGGWQHRDAMLAAINSGGCDAVSAAPSFIADPLLFTHVIKHGERRRPAPPATPASDTPAKPNSRASSRSSAPNATTCSAKKSTGTEGDRMIQISVEDRLLIQELSAQYAFRVDTKRYADAPDLFAEDGIWDETVLGIPRCEGRAQIAAFFPLMLQTDLEFMIHINANHQILESDGATARGTVHLHVAGRLNGKDIVIYGYYDDTYVKRDGQWLFQSRQLVAITAPQGDFRVEESASASAR